MDLFLSLLVIAVLLILACGLALWLVRQQRAVRQPYPGQLSSSRRRAPMNSSGSASATTRSYCSEPPSALRTNRRYFA